MSVVRITVGVFLKLEETGSFTAAPHYPTSSNRKNVTSLILPLALDSRKLEEFLRMLVRLPKLGALPGPLRSPKRLLCSLRLSPSRR